jgi:DNA end-binding protein Ku
MLRIAEHILETKAVDFDPAFLEDRYRTVLVDMLRSKKAELPVTISAPPPPSDIINLMDALKRVSAGRTPATKSTASKAAASKPSPPKRSNARGRKGR